MVVFADNRYQSGLYPTGHGLSSTENATGAGAQVVQSHGTESLLGISDIIVDVREFHIRLGRDGRPLRKYIQQHPQQLWYMLGRMLRCCVLVLKTYVIRLPFAAVLNN